MKIYPVSFTAKYDTERYDRCDYGRGAKATAERGRDETDMNTYHDEYGLWPDEDLPTVSLTDRLEGEIHDAPTGFETLEKLVCDALLKLTPVQEASVRGKHGIGGEFKTKRAVAAECGVTKGDVARAYEDALEYLRVIFAKQGYRPQAL